MSLSLLDVAQYYQGLPHQRQALDLLQTQIELEQPQLIVDSSNFVKIWRRQDEEDDLSDSDITISLADVAQHYQQEPHQTQALEILQSAIESAQPHLVSHSSGFAVLWRNQQPANIPQVKLLSNSQLEVQWRGQVYQINADQFQANVLDAVDPETGNRTDLELQGQFIHPAFLGINPNSGAIVVGTELLSGSFALSGVFSVTVDENGYQIRPIQLPGPRPLPTEQSTYPLRNIRYVDFIGDDLFIKHGDPSGAQSTMVIKSEDPASMEYTGCVDLKPGEVGGLCSQYR